MAPGLGPLVAATEGSCGFSLAAIGPVPRQPSGLGP